MLSNMSDDNKERFPNLEEEVQHFIGLDRSFKKTKTGGKAGVFSLHEKDYEDNKSGADMLIITNKASAEKNPYMLNKYMNESLDHSILQSNHAADKGNNHDYDDSDLPKFEHTRVIHQDIMNDYAYDSLKAT